MAKPITNADLFFVIFVAGYIFKWWIDTLQIALVANGRSCIVFRTDAKRCRLSPSRAFKDCLINISGPYLYIANVGCGAWSYDNG
jgi:hypothetical protein